MTQRHEVKAKQPNSKMCLVCGLHNPSGLQAAFYELDSDQLLGVFTPQSHHQGYPDRLHGGIAASMLDETMGRAIRLEYGDTLWGVTIELTTRYRRPVPLREPIRAVARITHETRRRFEGTGEILLPDDSIAVQAHGRYLKMPLDEISGFDFHQQEWKIVPLDDDPSSFELPPPPTKRVGRQQGAQRRSSGKTT